jgi:hypothetical protein
MRRLFVLLMLAIAVALAGACSTTRSIEDRCVMEDKYKEKQDSARTQEMNSSGYKTGTWRARASEPGI